MIIVTKVNPSFRAPKDRVSSPLPYKGKEIDPSRGGIEELLNAFEEAEKANVPLIVVGCLQDLIEVGIQKEDVEMI